VSKARARRKEVSADLTLVVQPKCDTVESKEFFRLARVLLGNGERAAELVYRERVVTVRAIIWPVMTGLAILAWSALPGAGSANATACLDSCAVSNGNASITYDAVDDDPGDFLLSGLEGWNVNGVAQLFQQVFAIRVGAGPTINIGNLNLVSADADDATDTIAVDYSDGVVLISLTMTLGGVGNGSAITQTLEVSAGSANLFDVPISVFLYTDLDLDDDAVGDTGQTDGATLTQRDGSTLARVSTTTKTSGFQIETFGDTGSLLFDAILDGSLASLSGSTGPVTGDVNHAFQWTFAVSEANPSFAIRVDNDVIPAPAPLGLLGLGMVGLGLARRKARA
jgi:hypothetical protein